MQKMMTCAAALLVGACGTEATADSAVAAKSHDAATSQGATESGADRSFMEEGGAVGCPNSPVSGHAGRVLDRISANDECGGDASSDQQGSGAAGGWILAGPKKIGIQSDPDSYSFDPLYLTCEGGRGQVMMMVVDEAKAKPAKQTVTFNIDDLSIAVPITVSVDEWGAVDASANLDDSHPLLVALPSAQRIRMTVAGRSLPLPVKGLNENWGAFKRACGIA